MRIKTPKPAGIRTDTSTADVRLRNLFAMARITLIDDSGPQRKLQVQTRSGDTEDDIPEFQPIGLRHKINGQVLLVRFGGDRRNTMAIASDAGQLGVDYLQAGDIALDDYRGLYIHATASGWVIECNGQPILMQNIQKLRVEGPIESTGEVTANCDSTPIALSTHLSSNVATGAGNSGPPVAP